MKNSKYSNVSNITFEEILNEIPVNETVFLDTPNLTNGNFYICIYTNDDKKELKIAGYKIDNNTLSSFFATTLTDNIKEILNNDKIQLHEIARRKDNNIDSYILIDLIEDAKSNGAEKVTINSSYLFEHFKGYFKLGEINLWFDFEKIVLKEKELRTDLNILRDEIFNEFSNSSGNAYRFIKREYNVNIQNLMAIDWNELFADTNNINTQNAILALNYLSMIKNNYYQFDNSTKHKHNKQNYKQIHNNI